MRQGGLPGAIDRAVGLIGDDHVEIAAGKLLIAADHGLEVAHGDQLFLSDHTRTEPVAAVLVQDILDGFERLLGQLISIHQKKDAFGASGLDQSLQVKANEICLPRSGGKIEQKAALAELDRLVERFHGVLLIGSDLALLALAQIIIGKSNGGQRLALLAQVDKSLQITS